MVDQRRHQIAATGSHPDDLLQSWLDLQNQDKANIEQSIEGSKVQKYAFKRLKSDNDEWRLRDKEIVANSILAVMAGSETTSTVLTFTIHNLVNHQDVQDRLRDELCKFKTDSEMNGNELDVEALNDLPYLHAVLNETMRIYPSAPAFLSRIATSDFHHKSFTIPKGAFVYASLWSLHRDARYWPEPEKFKPERFLPENRDSIVPYSFQPFGSGPRKCIGVKMAYLEMKMFLYELLTKYRLVPNERTERGQIEILPELVTIKAKNGVHFSLEKLNR